VRGGAGRVRRGQVNVISRAHFEESFRFARRSVSDKDVRKYEVFRCRRPALPARPANGTPHTRKRALRRTTAPPAGRM
jgi:hypothetical protein